ncbi:hypothetical protein GYMLUDRAFT_963111 [Collybiopsis luxurians FD-317 M1]|uniref:DUF6533 domain-containing protein n=1 Tax=Collybiopsis luxurians FD-317 M1 TaxID=944289 RepID=A0A0D0C4H4_9AGAR|nr:hypothetical protein GYMLUDRAFT_963111 [Collybiopsis luxurians FD-317 M1]
MNSAIIQELETGFRGNCAFTAAATLWIVNYLGTIPTEIHMIWSRKQSGTTILFIINRYSFLIFLLANSISSFPGESTDQECKLLDILFHTFESIAAVTTPALFALRIYALYDQSRIILAISALFILGRLASYIMATVSVTGISTAGNSLQAIAKCVEQVSSENLDLFYR